ncbi:MAG: quinone-dependent dihydroorotate dehydrogenase [Pikeienuella sp.]
MSVFEQVGLRAFRVFDPEYAHGLAIKALKSGLAPGARGQSAPDAMLTTSVAGLPVASPIGVAAGFDKNAEVPDAMLAKGYGFVEIGAVTPRPQAGNEKPRLFRLTQDRAAINRFGFNNEGLEAIAARLRARRGPIAPVWANLGANKDSDDRAEDYLKVMRGLHGLVGAMTLNISSPNTEKLRDLQGADALASLLGRAVAERDKLATVGARTPLFLKIAPDLTSDEIAQIGEIALQAKIDGVIATNTTLSREGLRSKHRDEKGGLSGRPLTARSLAVMGELRRATGGRLPLIGVGGIETAEDAYARIRAGASVVQFYTAMVYHGPGLGARIAAGLADLLRRDGFASPAEAVGVDIEV